MVRMVFEIFMVLAVIGAIVMMMKVFARENKNIESDNDDPNN